ncbi:MAG: ion transporter, partial [Candidatus Hydrogenedentota bacterium]
MNTPVKDTRREILREVIFEADTPAGKLFDVVLIIAILLSVGVVMLDSIKSLQEEWGHTFYALEWVFTILFTIEYILRLYCIGKPSKYAFSFFGIIDLLAILPTYISLFIPGTRYIAIVRILRVLRVFRILKIAQYVSEVEVLMRAVRASGRKITVFLFAMVTMVVILGSLM